MKYPLPKKPIPNRAKSQKSPPKGYAIVAKPQKANEPIAITLRDI